MKPANATKLHVELCPIRDVKAACKLHHRHLKIVIGGLVGLRVISEGKAVAWAMIGRPVSRHLQADQWVEYTRGIVPDGAPPNCASALLGFAAKWAKKQDRPICTYTLGEEPGTSLRAAGWVQVGMTRAVKSWASKGRPREDRVGAVADSKRRWVPEYCVDMALCRGFDLSLETNLMNPETLDFVRIGDRALHLSKHRAVSTQFSVSEIGVGTVYCNSLAEAEHFFAFLKGDPPVATPKTDAPPLSLIPAIPGVHFYYDYGRWHISLRSRQEEDRIVYVSRSAGVVRDDAIFRPLMACFTLAEERRRGLETWSSGVWAAGAKFIFPAIPPENTYISNLNFWGSTDFVPYAEATLAHSLGLVEAIDAEAAPAPGVRSVRLRGGTTVFVRRSTPLGLARGADGAWRVWLGDGEGWRPASGPSDALWKVVAPVCFGTPLDELTEWLPVAHPGAAEWEHLDGAGTPIPPDPKAKGEVLMMALVAGEVMSFLDNDIPAEDDREVFDAWTVYICT